MIIRKRPTPIELRVLEALMPRLTPRHKERRRIETDLAYSQKGFDGEKDVDRFTAALLKNNFTILHDVFLDSSFQIDSLIPGSHGIYIVEIKNYLGTVTFDFNLNQFTREHNGKVTGFRNPMIQATTNKLLLTEWLSDRGITDIPIYSLVAISDPSTIIKVIPGDRDISNEIMHGEYMPQQVMKLDRGNCHGHLHQKIGALILGECGTYDFDYRKKYGVVPSDILGGVQCPGCGRLGMERQYKYWECPYCRITDNNAYHKAIEDYILLVKPWMSNQECMQFLQMQSRNLATRVLKTSNLVYDPTRRKWNKR